MDAGPAIGYSPAAQPGTEAAFVIGWAPPPPACGPSTMRWLFGGLAGGIVVGAVAAVLVGGYLWPGWLRGPAPNLCDGMSASTVASIVHTGTLTARYRGYHEDGNLTTTYCTFFDDRNAPKVVINYLDYPAGSQPQELVDAVARAYPQNAARPATGAGDAAELIDYRVPVGSRGILVAQRQSGGVLLVSLMVDDAADLQDADVVRLGALAVQAG